MLDSFYHLTLKLLGNLIFGMKILSFCHYIWNIVLNVIYITLQNIYSISGLWILI